jgi:AraC-like DNA-binding protein
MNTRQDRRTPHVFRRELGRGEGIAPHCHYQPQLIYAASGLLRVTTARGTWMAPPHQAIWIPAGEVHSHRAYGLADLRAVLFGAVRGGHRGPAQPEVMAVTRLLRELILTLTDGRGRSPAVRARLEQVAFDELQPPSAQALYLPEPADDRLRAVTHKLKAHPANPASLANWGNQVGSSERTLSRLFAAEIGFGFRQWRTQLRVQYALVLLAQGATVTETALTVGWATPGSFISAFRQVVGQTPGQYVQSLSEGGFGFDHGHTTVAHGDTSVMEH